MTKTEAKILEEFEKSEVMSRVRAVESIAQVHGVSDYRGQTLQDFLLKALAAQREEILGVIAGMKINEIGYQIVQSEGAFQPTKEEIASEENWNAALTTLAAPIKEV